MRKMLLPAKTRVLSALFLLVLILHPNVWSRCEANNGSALRPSQSAEAQGRQQQPANLKTNSTLLPFEITFFLGEFGTRGDGPGQFNQPTGVAVDAWNNFYVVDNGNKRIQKFTAMGEFIAQWGQPGSGNTELSSPWGIAVDPAGYVYVTDNDKNGNGLVLKFTGDGTYVNQWGRPDIVDDWPHAWGGIAADTQGYIYVVESYYPQVWKFTSEGQVIGTMSGPLLYRPIGVAVDEAGFVYASDPINWVVSKFTPDGVHLENWLKDENGQDLFHTPIGLAVDPGIGLYVVNAKEGYQDIMRLSLNGKLLDTIRPFGMLTPQYLSPACIAVSPAGLIYVTDLEKNCVDVFLRFELGR